MYTGINLIILLVIIGRLKKIRGAYLLPVIIFFALPLVTIDNIPMAAVSLAQTALMLGMVIFMIVQMKQPSVALLVLAFIPSIFLWNELALVPFLFLVRDILLPTIALIVILSHKPKYDKLQLELLKEMLILIIAKLNN